MLRVLDSFFNRFRKNKKELSNLPKDNMTEICLLDAKGKLINQYGYIKKIDYLLPLIYVQKVIIQTIIMI